MSHINVDFDNTLTQDNVRYWAGETPTPDEEVIEAVRQCYYDHHTVIVWTARPWSEASSIAGWLTMWELPYHGIQCEKGSSDLYVDDKAVSPEELVAQGHEEVLNDD